MTRLPGDPWPPAAGPLITATPGKCPQPGCGADVLFRPAPLSLSPNREECDCQACGRIGYRLVKRDRDKRWRL